MRLIRRSFIWFAAAGLVLASCSVLEQQESQAVGSAESTEAEPTVAGGEVNGTFLVRGSTIIAADNTVFVPVGANVGAPVVDSAGKDVWLFRLNGHDVTTPESVAAVEAWGWNTLRLNISCIPDDAGDFNVVWGNEEMFAAVDQVVDVYTSKNIVVMLSCHDSLPQDGLPVSSTEFAQANEFWQQAADRYGENPYVWFNHYNEFHKSGEVESWQATVDGAYDFFADTGARNLIVFDLPIFGQDLASVLTDETLAWTSKKCNVLWGWHSYGGRIIDSAQEQDLDPSEFDMAYDSLLQQAGDVDLPLIVSEFGYDWNVDRQATNFNWELERMGALRAIEQVPTYGYGLLAWHANGDSGDEMIYGLKASDDATFSDGEADENLSELGTAFWAHSQSQKEAAPAAAPEGETCSR